MEAVRQALAALGNNATVAELQDYLLKRGIEMTAKFASTYKASILKKAKKAKALARKSAGKAEPAMPKEQPAPPAANGMKSAVQLQDVVALRGLLDRVGPEPLR